MLLPLRRRDAGKKFTTKGAKGAKRPLGYGVPASAGGNRIRPKSLTFLSKPETTHLLRWVPIPRVPTEN